MDPRTRMVLFKLLNQGTLTQLNGCISTGKEANVYHALARPGLFDGAEIAVKIFKTSILEFKDRDRYISGEFRYRRGYCKHNPRKMVKTWAEKELRNLKRISAAGITCPKPLFTRLHVLLMEFIGTDGWPAPRLRDAKLNAEKHQQCYIEVIKTMRIMFHKCRLVHADLSEYNILYFKKKLYFIDVGQAVEHDHPNAIEFLRMDCQNITDYFRKNDVAVMTPRQLFHFIVDPCITDDVVDDVLDEVREKK
eukprot:c47451_g1_i1.p1 GENE.c47451_g1_i1~~c47451_g1_i1.p1  ORF type:complete len:282 (-),score=62.58 c47451_g1_i1:427-1176(-)